MEVKALQQMLSQFRQMQENLQKQVDAVHVEASAGGGMVVVQMNGQKQVTGLKIEPEVFASKDQEMLQDLVQSAVNEAGRRGRRIGPPDEEPQRKHSRHCRNEDPRIVLTGRAEN
jgi:DNA-binding YbaB/EbfC family protein